MSIIKYKNVLSVLFVLTVFINHAYGSVYSSYESFCYDDLSRLSGDSSGVSAGCIEHYRYDSLGNIKQKNNLGYTYGSAGANLSEVGPNQLESVVKGGIAYRYLYDEIGNQIEANDLNGVLYQSSQWTAFGKPWLMTRRVTNGGYHSTEISYSPEGNRIRRRDYASSSDTVKDTTYIGGVYEKIEKDESVIYRHDIAGLATYNLKTNHVTSLDYQHYDHIGSLVAESQTLAQHDLFDLEKLSLYSFDAWGAPRINSLNNLLNTLIINKVEASSRKNNASQDSVPLLSEHTTQGFTGHEMLGGVELIHMNGRVYDSELGRFLSADPYIQAPENTQSFNRYAYVWNNPLSLTDPSGYNTQEASPRFLPVHSDEFNYYVFPEQLPEGATAEEAQTYENLLQEYHKYQTFAVAKLMYEAGARDENIQSALITSDEEVEMMKKWRVLDEGTALMPIGRGLLMLKAQVMQRVLPADGPAGSSVGAALNTEQIDRQSKTESSNDAVNKNPYIKANVYEIKLVRAAFRVSLGWNQMQFGHGDYTYGIRHKQEVVREAQNLLMNENNPRSFLEAYSHVRFKGGVPDVKNKDFLDIVLSK